MADLTDSTSTPLSAPASARALALAGELSDEVSGLLADADRALLVDYPGEPAGRQPVHTVYVPADRYTADTVPTWGKEALAAVDEHPAVFEELAGDAEVVARVRAKLEREPVEDLRIDFEDGYGNRPDETEDRDLRNAATALARSVADGTAAPFRGIRFKSLEAPTRARGLRTLTMFVAGLLEENVSLADFVVTLPKITSVDQVTAMARTTDRLEDSFGLDHHALRFELQIETPQSILGPDGTALVARMIRAGEGRVTALHYGTYDYSAYCGIAAPFQSMEHPVADHAKLVMQAAAAGTGVRLSDGSTNVVPAGDSHSVRRAWELHSRLVRRSLERGYYQGWDMHPAHLPTRFATTFAFYREGFAAAALRLRKYLGQVGGDVMDEPATVRALSDFIVRGLDSGALDASEVSRATGLEASGLVALARPTRA
jgi:citrate lyase beta subunit